MKGGFTPIHPFISLQCLLFNSRRPFPGGAFFFETGPDREAVGTGLDRGAAGWVKFLAGISNWASLTG